MIFDGKLSDKYLTMKKSSKISFPWSEESNSSGSPHPGSKLAQSLLSTNSTTQAIAFDKGGCARPVDLLVDPRIARKCPLIAPEGEPSVQLAARPPLSSRRRYLFFNVSHWNLSSESYENLSWIIQLLVGKMEHDSTEKLAASLAGNSDPVSQY